MNPSREYWGDLLTRRETRKVQEKAQGGGEEIEIFHFDKGNTLLASMGMLGRDFFELISSLETVRNGPLFAEWEEKNLLSIIRGIFSTFVTGVWKKMGKRTSLKRTIPSRSIPARPHERSGGPARPPPCPF